MATNTNNTVNRVELIGYMGAMPEMRFTTNGAPVTNFSMATNRIWRGQDGDVRKDTDWHRVKAWGRLAEVVKTYMGKGKRVRVIGRLEYQSWTDKESGEQRMRAVIVASQVLFLDYDRAHTDLPLHPEAEQPISAEDVQLEVEQPAKSKRGRRKQAA
jgi:single-strand DNA-binding protein